MQKPYQTIKFPIYWAYTEEGGGEKERGRGGERPKIKDQRSRKRRK
jgi:hypothetical protein